MALSAVVALFLGCDGGRDHGDGDAGFVPYDAARRDVMALPIDAGVDGGDGGVVPLDDSIVAFCADLSDAICDAADRCGCGSVDVAMCVMSYRGVCELTLFGPGVRSALADGRMRFDGAAAARMVEALRDPDVCDRRTIEPWTARDYYSFGGVLEGTRAAGDDCAPLEDTSGYTRIFHLDECAGGVCDANRCVTFESVGGTCDQDHFCADLELAVEHGWDLERTSLRCVRPTPGAPSGTCAARLAEGEACERNRDCESDACAEGTCAALGGIGESCSLPNACESGYCAPESSTCADGDLATGSPCVHGVYECASDYCFYDGSSSACAPPVCGAASYYDIQWILPRT